MWDYQMGWAMWLTVGLGTVAFWVVVALVVRGLLPGRGGSQPAPPDPLRLLDERFARGEIDVEEYQLRRRLLTDGR